LHTSELRSADVWTPRILRVGPFLFFFNYRLTRLPKHRSFIFVLKFCPLSPFQSLATFLALQFSSCPLPFFWSPPRPPGFCYAPVQLRRSPRGSDERFPLVVLLEKDGPRQRIPRFHDSLDQRSLGFPVLRNRPDFSNEHAVFSRFPSPTHHFKKKRCEAYPSHFNVERRTF